LITLKIFFFTLKEGIPLRKRLNIMFAVIILMMFSSVCRANKTGGGDAWSFLQIGVGARAMALGGAFVAMADDGSAAYWNPAGLAQREKWELLLMYTPYNVSSQPQASADYHYMSLATKKWRYGRSGLTFIFLKHGEIEHTIEDTFGELVRLGRFDDTEKAVILSYANAIEDVFFYGVNLKYMRQQFLEYHTNGLGGDAGFILNVSNFFNRWCQGELKFGYLFTYHNGRRWGSKSGDVDDDYKEDYLLSSRIGLACNPIVTEQLKWTVSAAVRQNKSAPMTLSLGTEIQFFEGVLALRGGFSNWPIELRSSFFDYEQLKYQRQFALGFGINYKVWFDSAILFGRLGVQPRMTLTLKY
jgi:hypothetical protein